MQIVLSSTPKRNRHGIGYQLHEQRKNGLIQKENRSTKFYSALSPLSWTFRSGGYINTSLSGEDEGVVMPFRTFTIHVIIEDKKEAKSACPTVYPCSSDFELDNWSIMEIPIAHKLIK